jgi:hypothetical protein
MINYDVGLRRQWAAKKSLIFFSVGKASESKKKREEERTKKLVSGIRF